MAVHLKSCPSKKAQDKAKEYDSIDDGYEYGYGIFLRSVLSVV